jgi:hypothetical protein
LRSGLPQIQIAMPPFLIGLAALSTQRVLDRTEDWNTDLSLYESAVVVCANSAKNHDQLGQILENDGSEDAAYKHYIRSQELDPGFCDVEFHMAQLLLRRCQRAVLATVEQGEPGPATLKVRQLTTGLCSDQPPERNKEGEGEPTIRRPILLPMPGFISECLLCALAV